ncbi:hypothetical protein OPT61_g9265 [Boeremia exigua]|uniref:Uncharacterized protein n=1 Tax=Boeremia exigua TaxID=749465 RepID=A0ACC2HV67_9PLEO|nr:hypothetical protein OPT61_g9265 [Boeremia exigua]
MLRSKLVPAYFYPECYHRGFTTIRALQSTNFRVRYPCVTTGPRFSTISLTPSPEPSIEYRWIDGVECLEMYEPGGYHPVMIDDLLHNRYRILDKLGYGGYSTIWLARDETAKRYVAVKIGISSPSPRREIEVLRVLHSSRSNSYASDISACTALPSVLDAFDIHGSNGTHICYTLTPAQESLREASFSRLFPIQVARALAAKLATAVAFVHSRGFVHGGLSSQLLILGKLIPSPDLHLRNVLVRLPSTFDELSVEQFREKFGEPDTVPVARVDEKPLTPNAPAQAVVPLYLGKKAQEFTLADAHGLLLSDFGEAFSPATQRRLGKNCNTPLPSRAPEAFFEPDEPLSYPSDIWTLGLAIWELLGMKFLFSESEPRDEIVAEQIDVLGYHTVPPSWRAQWERPATQDDSENAVVPRRPTGDRESWPALEDAFEEFVQKYRRKREAAGVFDEKETKAILRLVRGMLAFRPEERWTVEQVLGSEWMVGWALPQLEHGCLTRTRDTRSKDCLLRDTPSTTS